MGFEGEWGECGGDDGEDLGGEGAGGCEFLFLFLFFFFLGGSLFFGGAEEMGDGLGGSRVGWREEGGGRERGKGKMGGEGGLGVILGRGGAVGWDGWGLCCLWRDLLIPRKDIADFCWCR